MDKDNPVTQTSSMHADSTSESGESSEGELIETRKAVCYNDLGYLGLEEAYGNDFRIYAARSVLM